MSPNEQLSALERTIECVAQDLPGDSTVIGVVFLAADESTFPATLVAVRRNETDTYSTHMCVLPTDSAAHLTNGAYDFPTPAPAIADLGERGGRFL